MTLGTYLEQNDKTKNTKNEDLIYYGVWFCLVIRTKYRNSHENFPFGDKSTLVNIKLLF